MQKVKNPAPFADDAGLNLLARGRRLPMRTEMTISPVEERTDHWSKHFRIRSLNGHTPPIHGVFSLRQAAADCAFRQKVFAIVMVLECLAANQVAI
jgi:hypothetical protein